MRDNIDLSIEQFIEAWRVMCAATPGAALKSEADVEYIFSRIPIAFFNVAILTGRGLSADTFRTCAERACAFAAGYNVPWLFVVTHDALDPGVDASAVVESSGLAPVMPMTGMLANSVAPPASVPDGLTLVHAQDDDACAAVLDVNALAYGMDLEAGKLVIGKASFWADHFAVVGYAEGRPASSAAVLMVEGHRYVALVATDPAQQRRGYAEATMRRALELSARAHPERPTVLHATDAGRPIYERMGYQPIASHTLYMEKKFLEAH